MKSLHYYKLLAFALSLLPLITDGAGFGDIPASLAMPAGTSVRRNAGNSAFESFTPGNVSNSGTPLLDQVAVWTDATHIKGVTTIKGGTTGQALVKVSDSDYDYTWATVAQPTPTATATVTPSATATPTPTPTPYYAFGTVAVSGQSDIVADAAPDTLTMAAGNAIILTTNASTDTVTIAVATPTATATATPSATATPTPTATATATVTQGFTAHFSRGGEAIQANDTIITPWTCPYSGTITGYSISADTGTCTLKTWKKANGTAIPTIADVISTNGVSLSSGTHIRSSTVSDFTTTVVTAGDMFMAQVTATSGPTDITFQVEITR